MKPNNVTIYAKITRVVYIAHLASDIDLVIWLRKWLRMKSGWTNVTTAQGIGGLPGEIIRPPGVASFLDQIKSIELTQI
jgi:hypothetical protein